MKSLQIFLIIIFLFISTVSIAGVVNKEIEENVDASKISSASALPSNNLRCWQKGKLLFEELNYGLSSNNNMHMIKFNHNQKQKQSLGLINLGETICVYQHAE